MPFGYRSSPFLPSPQAIALVRSLNRKKSWSDWWFLALFIVFAIFNTILGEEFLFRGVLLPKMEGVFGRWSWVANGVLFGFWHVHQPWGIVGSVVSGVFFYAFPTWRFRSTWMGIIVHSGQSVFIAFLILGIVLGLA